LESLDIENFKFKDVRNTDDTDLADKTKKLSPWFTNL